MVNLYNANLELSVLSCLFQDGSQWAVVEDILTKKSFKFPAHGFIFNAMGDVVNADLYPDVVTVSSELDRKNMLDAVVLENGLRGLEALNYIKDMKSNVDNLESYALQVQQLQANRQLLLLSQNIEQWVNNGGLPIDILEKIDTETGKIGAFVGSRSNQVKSANDAVMSSLINYEETRKGNKRYIETGLKAWDSVTNGLFKQRVYMVAAKSGEGKSALVQNFIKRLSVDKKHHVHIFSLEMSAEDLVNRLVQILTGISPLDIEKGELKDFEQPLYEEAIAKIGKATYTCDDSSDLSLALLRTKARKAVAAGAEVIIIDQLEQLHIGGSGDSQPEYIKINYISYRIKALSRELDVPIILVHQLNRGGDPKDGNKEKRDPQLSDLAQAGEKAVDCVMMLRTSYDASFHFVKHRQGKKGKVNVEWDGSHILFSDPVEIFPDKLL